MSVEQGGCNDVMCNLATSIYSLIDDNSNIGNATLAGCQQACSKLASSCFFLLCRTLDHATSSIGALVQLCVRAWCFMRSQTRALYVNPQQPSLPPVAAALKTKRFPSGRTILI
eukprot:gnl/MRDRNA2_/MRDRNA2_519849_c0_seq1.p1 gnl/MRDRNA2_/MRDRNA2_519849_c0~~gnl/MRDRNA2_/MRDRNA2_519849_c0_seq1.p1  ORF type:complete len:121 (+),score=9.33 gnl/MRDRNA2_/MRDRNA2_519849_c0_seq1:24-365(+)